jgi:hypothetical protein
VAGEERKQPGLYFMRSSESLVRYPYSPLYPITPLPACSQPPVCLTVTQGLTAHRVKVLFHSKHPPGLNPPMKYDRDHSSVPRNLTISGRPAPASFKDFLDFPFHFVEHHLFPSSRRSVHGRMAEGGHGLPKVSPGPGMPYPYTPCGQATPENASRSFQGWPT